jgi:DNA adenine methylase
MSKLPWRANAPVVTVAKVQTVEREVRIIKDESRHLVYGVALEPDLRDSQDDEVGPEEIEKAAHNYMEHSQRADVQHDERPADVALVENFIAPQDLEIEGEHVTKGSWVQVWKVHDPEVWTDIQEGRITGLSIGGTAERV